jgi:hypothetical protein
MRLNAGHAAKNTDRAIEHPQGPLDLDREIHVSGRIDDVDPAILQKQVVAADVMVMPRSCS